jgi:large subunit ribosomal protein L19e
MKLQKRLAAQILKCSTKRIVFDENQLDDISQAITKDDIRRLIGSGAIIRLQKKGISKGRSNLRRAQKAKGRLRGIGSRKGKYSARGDTLKRRWMNKIRLQRSYLAGLKVKKQINNEVYRDLYRKAKGGFFRSRRHIELYLEEKGILKART